MKFELWSIVFAITAFTTIISSLLSLSNRLLKMLDILTLFTPGAMFAVLILTLASKSGTEKCGTNTTGHDDELILGVVISIVVFTIATIVSIKGENKRKKANSILAKRSRKQNTKKTVGDIITKEKRSGYKKVKFLIVALHLHSILIGLAWNTPVPRVLMFSVMLHRIIENAIMGVTIAILKFSKIMKVVLCLFYFSMTSIGIIISNYGLSNEIQSFVNGVALGSTLFVAMIRKSPAFVILKSEQERDDANIICSACSFFVVMVFTRTLRYLDILNIMGYLFETELCKYILGFFFSFYLSTQT